MIDVDLLTQAHAVAMAVAPELKVRPLYLLRGGEATWIPSTACALASTHADPYMRDALESRGEWKGSGPFIVFNDENLTEAEFWVIFLHEMGHTLPAVSLEVVSTPETRAARDADLAAATAKYPGEPGWTRGHGTEWLRICCHLWWRLALTCNRVVPFHHAYDGAAYDLSYPQLYMEAIGNEPLLMRDFTFADIVASPKPTAFQQLFNWDYERYLQAHPKPQKEKVA